MYTDELALVSKIKGGDRLAVTELLDSHRQFVTSIARKYYLVGGDIEDLVQEGMMGLYDAALSYDVNKNDSFRAYAHVVIVRRILQAIRKNNTYQNKALSDVMYLDGDDGVQIVSDEADPEDDLLQNEKVEEMLQSMREHLSAMENEVLGLYLDGFNYHDIAHKLHKSDKSIDNALTRIKSKLKDIFYKGE